MINNRLNKQQIITAAVLLLLVIAVQVATERTGDWMFIGLNLIEIGIRLSEVHSAIWSKIETLSS